MLRRAFEVQLAGGGLSIVEVLSTCPVGWGMTPTEAMDASRRRRRRDLPARGHRGPPGGRGRGLDATRGLTDGARARSSCGFGGQGLLFAGQVLAQAALLEGREVSWMPSYGPEMRGGTASCTVVIADHPIGSPIVDVADSVIALNPPSMAKYEPILAPGGLLVVNGSLIEADPDADRPRGRARSRAPSWPGVPATTGWSASSRSAASSPGARSSRADSVREALTELVGRHHPELLDADLAAFDAGLRWAEVVATA